MATDQSPTQNKLIVTIALLAVCTLVSLKFILGSYYISMTEAEAHAEIAPPDDIMKLRADQNKQLQQAAVPIDVAMKNLATSGRDNAPPVISPQQSNDMAPLAGWSRLPLDAGVFTAPPAPTPMSVFDAGTNDGGKARAADAGRSTAPPTAPPHAPPDAGH